MQRFVFMLTLLVALPAFAQQGSTQFTYQAMLNQLRASGIDPSQVAWAEVNPLCTGYMSYNDDDTEFNQCLYDKATTAVAFATDRETCDIEALALTPDSIQRQPTAVISRYNPGTNDGTQTVVMTPRITWAELRTQRAATYNRCMREAGWRSPRDWRLGYAR